MKKILVVDDEPEIVELLSIRLSAHGYDISTALSGRDAIEIAKKIKPDLIILDVMMPPPDGYEVCRMLRKDASLKSVPIILLTAKASDSDRAIGYEAGANAYITKPYNPKALLATIGELVEV